jgi:AcrR family transcriptional regulator
MSNRDIAAAAGVSKTTVNEYLGRAEAAGVGWPLPEELDGEALEALLFPVLGITECRVRRSSNVAVLRSAKVAVGG